MGKQVIYTPERTNTSVLLVEVYTSDWKESYWMKVATFPDTDEGLKLAKQAADAEAADGKRVHVARSST